MASACHDDRWEDLFGEGAKCQDGQTDDTLANIRSETDKHHQPDQKIHETSDLEITSNRLDRKEAVICFISARANVYVERTLTQIVDMTNVSM